MGVFAKIHRWFKMEEHHASQYERPSWQPIASAPSGEHILLAWNEGDDEYDWFLNAATLQEGRWVDGPGPQPDWWMSEPDRMRQKPISTAPDGESLVLIWDDEDCYDFDVGELIDGKWQDGPVQPTGWIPVGRPPPGDNEWGAPEGA